MDRNSLCSWWWRAGLGLMVGLQLGADAWAQSGIEATVEELRAEMRRQDAKIDGLQARVAELSGDYGQSTVEEMHEHILDLELVDERVEHALRNRGIPDDVQVIDAPGWLDGLVLSSDLRVRYDGQFFDDKETYPEDRNRGRFRLRFGMSKTWGDDWKAEARLASGADEADNTNQTFTDFFGRKVVQIDLAYVTWTPQQEWLRGLEVTAGKMHMPFLTTWNYWDDDVNPEGIFEKYTFDFGDFRPYGNFGQFAVEEHATVPDDMTLLAYGGGFDWDIGDTGWDLAFAANYYDFTHVRDNPPTLFEGNSIEELPDGTEILAAGDFDILDFVWNVTGTLWNVPVHAYANYGLNTDLSDIPGQPDTKDHFSFGLALGQHERQGDFMVEWAWAYNEADSGIGLFMASELDGAGKRGSLIRSFYRMTDFAELIASYYALDTMLEEPDVDHEHRLILDIQVYF